ncbi:MAG TPA: hypothetical protein PK156_09670 [Polyangium sp.]|nr:hypothetical protein [Polyangium sp.]
MSSPTITKIDLNISALHVEAAPGTDIVIRGSFTSKHDGSIVDAVTTKWPKEAPGGEHVDAIGLFDFDGSGLHMASRDLEKHEVHLLVEDTPGPACAAAGVASPCLLMNKQLATTRLLVPKDFHNTLTGTMELEVPQPLPPPVVPVTAVPYLQIMALFVFGGGFLWGGWRWKKGKDSSPEGQLIALSKKVMAQLERADQVIAAPLKPTVDAAVKAIREKRVDAASKEGKRVAEALRRVNQRLETTAQEERAAKEQEAADELLREMESALEAAEEMKRSHS